MEKERIYIYAFLSRIFADVMDEKLIEELKNNKELLEMMSPEALELFQSKEPTVLQEELNVDFTSLFLMNSQPIESSVLDNKDEVLVGLQNPVMQFYFSHGYELNLSSSKVQTPDHLCLECAFMQNLIQRGEQKAQISFLENHILQWAPIYLLGLQDMAQTPFFRDLCDFAAEFFIADYDALQKRVKDG